MTVISHQRLTNIDALKTEILDNITISQVAERLGLELQASGDQYRSLCPVHDENTPSCYFSNNKHQWHCFGCKAGGDHISLVEQVRHLGFIETLYWLSAEADIDISKYERPPSESEKNEEEIRAFCEGILASRVYQAHPDCPSVGGPRYSKRLDVDTATLFGVGVSPGLGDASPFPYFQDKYYLFKGVMLPWRMPSGRLVGWRVRELEGEEKKVISTSNDFILGKLDHTLFGIQIAREHIKNGKIVLVEGEYDCMALHAAGIYNVVAMGGSSLSDEQMKLLESLHIREVVALFDGDTGGFKASQVFAEKYWSHNIFVRVQTCNDDYDPEDMVKKYGDWATQSIIDSAYSALEYLLRLEWSKKPRNTLTEKLEFVKWIRDTYGARLRSTDESLVLSEVAKWLQIPELEIRDYVRAADGSLCAVDSERLLIGKACRDRQFYIHLRGQLAREDFFVLKHQRIWDLLANMLIDGHDFDVLTLVTKAQQHGVPEGYIEGCAELSDSNWEYHTGVVADLALRRSARDDVAVFRDKITDLNQPADVLVGDLTYRITAKALQKSGSAQKQLSEQVDEAIETLHERMSNESEIWGLDLGLQLPRLSRILQGLQPGRLYLVSAVSRVGKTSLLTQMATSIGVHQSIPIDFVSMEMDENEILYKMASHMTGINSEKISGGRLDSQEAKAVEYAMLRIRNSPLKLWCPDGMTSTEFLLYSREAVMQRRTKAFFVDYVQLIDPEVGQEKDNGYKLYGDFARMSKMKVARAMDVAVICAAQLRREAAGKERPTSEDMGDSYAMVRHSNVVIILHGKEDSSTLELFVDKNRGGSGGGLIPIIYDRPIQTFREASGGAHSPEYMVRV